MFNTPYMTLHIWPLGGPGNYRLGHTRGWGSGYNPRLCGEPKYGASPTTRVFFNASFCNRRHSWTQVEFPIVNPKMRVFLSIPSASEPSSFFQIIMFPWINLRSFMSFYLFGSDKCYACIFYESAMSSFFFFFLKPQRNDVVQNYYFLRKCSFFRGCLNDSVHHVDPKSKFLLFSDDFLWLIITSTLFAPIPGNFEKWKGVIIFPSFF